MNLRWLDLGLIAGAIALGAYLGLTAGASTTAELAARPNNVFSTFSPDDVTSIRIDGPHLQTTLVRAASSSEFSLGAPDGEVADAEAIDQLLTSLEFAQFSRRDLSPQLALSELGFDSPKLEVNIEAGARTYRLLLGRNVPHAESSVYAQVSGRNVRERRGTVKKQLLEDLRQSKQSLRGKVLFGLSRRDLKSLQVSYEGARFSLDADELSFLVRQEQESGSLPQDNPPSQGTRADRKAVEILLHHLSQATLDTHLPHQRAVAFLSQHQSSQEAASPLEVVELGDKIVYRARFFSTCPGDETLALAVRDEPSKLAGCLPRHKLAALRLTPRELVDSSAAPFHADEIDHVIIHTPPRRLEVLRVDAGFVLQSRDAEEVPIEAGNEFLAALSQGQLELLSRAPTSSSRRGTLTLKGHLPSAAPTAPDNQDSALAETSHTLTLELYENGEELFVKRLDDGRWLAVPPWFRWAFSADDSWARSRTLSGWQTSQLTHVSIETAAGRSQELKREGDTFVFVDGKVADQSHMQLILETLTQLRAQRFVRSRPPPGSALLKVRFQAAGGTHSLTVGKRVRGGHLAWATFVRGTFVLPLEAVDALGLSLHDRSAIFLDTKNLSRLSIDWDGRHLLLERRAGRLALVSGDGTDDVAAPLGEALMGLEVLSAELPSPADPPGATWLKLEGQERGGQQFSISWGKPTIHDGHTMIPARKPDDPLVYWISERSAEVLLKIL